MSNPCEHCGATASETLLGFPVVVHEESCPKTPKPSTTGELIIIRTKRWLCVYCGTQWDKPGEAEHALDCPANPMTN